MTELLAGTVEVRTDPGGAPVAVRWPAGWRRVLRVVNRWRVETDWWRQPVRRDYFRCLLSEGSCIELYCDLDSGGWWLSRRYD